MSASGHGAAEDPLGIALRLLGYSPWPRPRAVEVADALIGDDSDPAWRAILGEALAFIEDWDAGRVTDLAEAVGRRHT